MARIVFFLLVIVLLLSTSACSASESPLYTVGNVSHQVPPRRLFGRTGLVSLPQKDDPPRPRRRNGFDTQTFFDFYQFRSTLEPAGADQESIEEVKQNVARTILEVQSILVTTMQVLGREAASPTITNPSFKRYFSNDREVLVYVMSVFERILAVIGTAKYKLLRQCAATPFTPYPLSIWFGDPPDDILWGQPSENKCSTNLDVLAYRGTLQFGNEGWRYAFVALCPVWFNHYRRLDLAYKNRPDLWPRMIDNGCTNKVDMLTWVPAQTLLHEFLHYHEAYRGRGIYFIGDRKFIRQPQAIAGEKAYGGWRSMKIKDRGWTEQAETPFPELQNDDNYVFMAMEMYYKEKYGLADWEDPIDPNGAPRCPSLTPDIPTPANDPGDE